MKAHRNVALTITALALTCIFLNTAHAQQAVTKDARFTLPWRAMWADTILPPGDYTLSVVKLSGGRGVAYTVRFVGAGIDRTIVAVKRPGSAVGERSMLVAQSRGEIHSVRALHLPLADLVLTFPESKAERELVARGPETMQSVPLLLAAK